MIAQVIKQISNFGESVADSHKLYKFLQKLKYRKMFSACTAEKPCEIILMFTFRVLLE